MSDAEAGNSTDNVSTTKETVAESSSEDSVLSEEPVELFTGDRKVENIVSFEETLDGRAVRINVSEFYKQFTEWANEREAQEKSQAEKKLMKERKNNEEKEKEEDPSKESDDKTVEK